MHKIQLAAYKEHIVIYKHQPGSVDILSVIWTEFRALVL